MLFCKEAIDIPDNLPLAIPALFRKSEHRPGVEHIGFDLDLIILHAAADKRLFIIRSDPRENLIPGKVHDDLWKAGVVVFIRFAQDILRQIAVRTERIEVLFK